MTIHLNIGSNSGRRRAQIERALAALRDALPGRMVTSDYIETEPWGFESANKFLNIGVMIVTERDYAPLEVLEITQGIERSICLAPHRDATGAYIDREIDIDIIAMDDIVSTDPRIILPHPRAHLRDFVMIPLLQCIMHNA